MSMKDLASFCRRVGISVNAGLNLLDAVKREAGRQRDPRLWLSVAHSLEEGNSFAESLQPHRARLGEMFVALVQVGEESGRLGETLIELADYFDEMLRIRRDFLRSLIWPAVEFVAAVVIVGVVILLLGFIEQITGTRIDLLGFGLVGFPGLVRYVIILCMLGVSFFLLYLWVKRSVQRSRAVHYFLDRTPKIGRLFRSIALMKLTWGLHMTMRTGMDVRRALALAFRGVGYAPVTDNLPSILDVIESGGSLTDAFLTAGNLDGDLITSIDSGEQSGSMPELMQKLTEQYLQESLLNLKVVSVVGGFVVYGCIMAMIAFIIIRIALFYIGMLNAAAAGI